MNSLFVRVDFGMRIVNCGFGLRVMCAPPIFGAVDCRFSIFDWGEAAGTEGEFEKEFLRRDGSTWLQKL